MYVSVVDTFVSARDCGYLPVPNNGSITGNKTTYPNQLSFSCDDGFDLIGSSDRQCQAVGKWSGKQPHCKGNEFCFLIKIVAYYVLVISDRTPCVSLWLLLPIQFLTR